MYNETMELMIEAAKKKVSLLQKNNWKYLMAAALAGIYVGIGNILIMVVGSYSEDGNHSMTKVFMGLSFGISLSLVIMVGAELFTGNNMLMATGVLAKKVTLRNGMKIWIFSYLGNFIGSIILGGIYIGTGVSGSHTGEFIVEIAQGKINQPISAMFYKGILCNVLVCLAVLCGVKLKTEAGKLMMIFWCLFAFITSGFEHSVANMSIFVMALLLPHTELISISGAFTNLLFVTLGNIVGGVFLGIAYYYIGSEKKTT